MRKSFSERARQAQSNVIEMVKKAPVKPIPPPEKTEVAFAVH
jgi:hypothetical protein